MRGICTALLTAALLVAFAQPSRAQQPGAATRAQPANADVAAELRNMRRQLASMQRTLTGLRSELSAEAAARTTLQARTDGLRKELDAAYRAIRALQANSILDLNGYVSFDNSGGYPTALFNGINLQVVNGTGSTQSTNGLGNIIVGYNRPRTTAPLCSLGYYETEAECTARGGAWARSHKSGSHNLVVGDYNSYSSWGGAVFGLENAIGAPYATITGGAGNRALGDLSSVAAGSLNTADGMYGSVGGGLSNAASGAFSTVGGGSGRITVDTHDWSAGSLTQDR